MGKRIKGKGMKSTSGVAGLSLLGLAIVGCQAPDVAPFRPRDMQLPARAQAAQVVTPAKVAVPTVMRDAPTTRPAAGEVGGTAAVPEPVALLTLQEVVHRTVMNNGDLRVAGYDPAIDETRVTEAEARFDPSFFTELQIQEQIILSPTESNPAAVNPFNPSGFRTQSLRAGVRQQLETGGQVEVSYGTQRINRIDAGFGVAGPNPYYLNEMQVKFSQPLLRDFGSDVNRARITIARNNQRISVLEFRKTIEEQLSQVEEAYWRLAEAQRQVQILEDLLDQTLETTRILQVRQRQGLDVTRAQLGLAGQRTESRIADLIRARARVRDLSDEVKKRMNDPDMPVSTPTLILPKNDPLEEAVSFDYKDQIDAAFEYRFELAQQQLRINSAGVAQDVAKNNLNPQLDLQGQLNFPGPGEDFGDAAKAQKGFDQDNSSYQLGFNFEIPFGNRAARAVFRRAQLQRLQAIEQYRALLNQVEQEVKVAHRDVTTSYQEIVARQREVLQAQDALGGLLERERAGVEALSPAYIQTKLDAQERLANSRQQQVTAISTYNIAISRLERAKGTLLRYDNVLLEEAPLQR